MDDYNDVCEKLKEDKVHDEELWQPYDLDYEEHQQYAENLIENRISSKKNRNSVPATSDLFKVFENSWSDWIPLMTPRAKEHFFMRPGQSGYRIGMKELKFHLEKFELKGGGIFEFGTAEWIVQVDDHKQTGEDEGVRDRSEPKKVVFIAYASEIGVAIDRYCRDGSHPAKSEVINRVLTKGDQAIMVRGRRSENPERDKDVVLKKYRYPWNEVYPDVLIYNKFPDFADSFIKPVIEVKSQHGFMTMRHRKQLPAKLDPEESVDESWIDAPSVGGQQGDSKTAHDSGKSKVPRDVDALAEKIKEYLARPISYELFSLKIQNARMNCTIVKQQEDSTELQHRIESLEVQVAKFNETYSARIKKSSSQTASEGECVTELEVMRNLSKDPYLRDAICYVGMKNGKILDSAITASSEYDYNDGKQLARLDDFRGWCVSDSDLKVGAWIQVDFREPKVVVGVVTQGRSDGGAYTKSYNVSCGVEGRSLESIKENGSDKIFDGNFDSLTAVTNLFPAQVTCRYIRIIAQSWYLRIVLRLEFIYGFCDKVY